MDMNVNAGGQYRGLRQLSSSQLTVPQDFCMRNMVALGTAPLVQDINQWNKEAFVQLLKLTDSTYVSSHVHDAYILSSFATFYYAELCSTTNLGVSPMAIDWSAPDYRDHVIRNEYN